jgi:hypothetical protein
VVGYYSSRCSLSTFCQEHLSSHVSTTVSACSHGMSSHFIPLIQFISQTRIRPRILSLLSMFETSTALWSSFCQGLCVLSIGVLPFGSTSVCFCTGCVHVLIVLYMWHRKCGWNGGTRNDCTNDDEQVIRILTHLQGVEDTTFRLAACGADHAMRNMASVRADSAVVVKRRGLCFERSQRLPDFGLQTGINFLAIGRIQGNFDLMHDAELHKGQKHDCPSTCKSVICLRKYTYAKGATTAVERAHAAGIVCQKSFEYFKTFPPPIKATSTIKTVSRCQRRLSLL